MVFVDNDELSALAIAAIGALPTEAETEAASKPPYPTPKCHVAFEKAAREALKTRLAQRGGDPMCSMRLMEPAARFSAAAALELNHSMGFDVSDMICLLLAGGLIPVATAIKAMDVSGSRMAPRFICRAVVYRLLADGDVEAAKSACVHLSMGDEAWVNWRAVGEYYAERADVESFLALWKKYSARQERDWMDAMRRALVESVSESRGWREAAKLTERKEIGVKGHTHGMLYVVLLPLARNGGIAALKELFEMERCLSGLSETGKIQLLIDALNAVVTRPPQTDHPELDEIISRIIAIDPAVSKQQSRQRDWLLIDCWPLIGEEATLRRVRAAVRAPIYRRELKTLAKEGAIG